MNDDFKLMHPECKLAFIIPVFNEDIKTVLIPLKSLSSQVGVAREDFEVVFIVSNNKRHAIKRTAEFLQNQKTIAFLRTYQKRHKSLIMHIIDKSSKNTAEKLDSANMARHWAGTKICERFFKLPIGENGIIALSDCDCEFSKNYVAEIIRTFKPLKVNRVAGKWQTRADKSYPHPQLLKQALAIHGGLLTDHKIRVRPARRAPLVFQKGHKLTRPISSTGQNLTVRVRAWLRVGGIGSSYSFDDMIFGYKVSALPGETVYNPNISVCTLARASERVGAVSLGRRIKMIQEAIDNFLSGKSSEIRLPDWQKMVVLFHQIHKFIKADKAITEDLLWDWFKKYGMDVERVKPRAVGELASLLNKQPYGQIGENGLNKIEDLILKEFYPYIPKITLGKS